MLTIDEFCDKHNACADGREWALAHCENMADAWVKLPDDYLIWVATRPGVLTDLELRQFALWCARQVEHLMEDERSKEALNVVERFLNGEATQEELKAARSAADAAARSADARSAAADAARFAARSAADAAWSAARSAQVKYLRENTKPNFK